MMEIKAVRVTEWPNRPGEFMFTTRQNVEGHAGVIFCCPCGCGECGSLSFSNANDGHPSWDWNGSEDKPTLRPSILKTTGCKWHGYLTDGVFRKC